MEKHRPQDQLMDNGVHRFAAAYRNSTVSPSRTAPFHSLDWSREMSDNGSGELLAHGIGIESAASVFPKLKKCIVIGSQKLDITREEEHLLGGGGCASVFTGAHDPMELATCVTDPWFTIMKHFLVWDALQEETHHFSTLPVKRERHFPPNMVTTSPLYILTKLKQRKVLRKLHRSTSHSRRIFWYNMAKGQSGR